MKNGNPKKPQKIRVTVSLEPNTLAILEEWEKRYDHVGKRDRFINGAIEFMKSQDSDGLDASYQPVNRMHYREGFYEYFIKRAREEGALPKEILPPQKPGRLLRLVLPEAVNGGSVN